MIVLKETCGAKGFTLVELVVVIVILGILSISLTALFSDTTRSFLQSESRIEQASSARIAVEKLSRDIRQAMPNSIRVNASNTCVEYVPIVGASRYIELPTSASSDNLTVMEHDASSRISGLGTDNLFVMVIPLNNNEVYNASVGHVASVIGFSKLGAHTTRVRINNTRFMRTSPAQRLFFVSLPQSYCIEGERLNLYRDYGYNLVQPEPIDMGTPSLILDRLTTASTAGNPIPVFRYHDGTLNRGALLLINLQILGRDNERVTLEHEVHVRNFP